MNIALKTDCMEYMRSLPDKYFELAVVDPPYGDAGGGVLITPSGCESQALITKPQNRGGTSASADASTATRRIPRTGIRGKSWGGIKNRRNMGG